MPGRQGVYDLGRFQNLLDMIISVDQRRDAHIDAANGARVRIRIRGFAFPKIIFGHPEAVALGGALRSDFSDGIAGM